MNNAAGQVKTINLPVSEHFVANSGNNPCVICGRELKNPRLYLHVVDGGSKIIDPDESWEDESSDLGMLPVGPECVRNHPQIKPYVIKT